MRITRICKRVMVSCVLILCMGNHFMFSEEIVRLPRYSMTRDYAFGGRHAALADDFSVLYNNPAGFRSVDPELHFADLSVHAAGPVFSMTDAIMNMELARLFTEGLARYVALGIPGPISFGYVGDGLGFGIQNASSATISVSGITRPAKAEVAENLILSGGYAGRIPFPEESGFTLDLGFLLKGFLQSGVSIEKDAVEIIGLVSNPNPGIFLTQPFYLQTGIGLDVGLLGAYDDQLFLGIAVRDLYTPTMKNLYNSINEFSGGYDPASVIAGKVPLDMSVGFMWQPRMMISNKYVSEFRLMIDYKDIWDFLLVPEEATNPILHVGVGSEIVVLDILSLRVGMDEGLLNAGLGLDLYFFNLDMAMFGKELGVEPGMSPVYNLVIGLSFSL